MLSGAAIGQNQSTKNKEQSSEFENASVIDIQRFAVAENCNDDAQAHSRFSRRHSHNNEDEKLARDILKETRKGDERQVHGVEHQLDAHEHRDYVALYNYACGANRKQNRRERQIPG
jgi:hypothetical protein